MKMGIFEAKSARIERVEWMARRLRSATLCRASLRYGGERISGCGEKRSAEGNSQIDWSMALYLRGKKRAI
jgi:hypothetical protein